jgi:hypothetical protein
MAIEQLVSPIPLSAHQICDHPQPSYSLSPQQAKTIASEWITRFQAFISSVDPTDSSLDDLLTPDVAWRDLLTFSWNFRTITGLDNVRSYLRLGSGQGKSNAENKLSERSFECLGIAEKMEGETKEVNAGPGPFFPLLSNSKLRKERFAGLSWIQVVFDYATDFGNGKGVVSLMLDPQSQIWKAR